MQLQRQAQVLQEVGDHERAESLLVASLGLLRGADAAAPTTVAVELDLAYTLQQRFDANRKAPRGGSQRCRTLAFN